MGIRGIVVSVDFGDMLAVTLQQNMRFLEECMVVTSPDDEETMSIAGAIPNVRVVATNAFYQHGAVFNKGLALERGMDILGRDGWILAWDVDILFPNNMKALVDESRLHPSKLYGTERRFQRDPQDWRNWSNLKRGRPDKDIAGFFQLFHADCQYIAERPWYDVTFTHAGGGDGYFASRWPAHKKVRLPFYVMHLGEPGINWFGRVADRIDGMPVQNAGRNKAMMERYLAWKGWGRPEIETQFTERVDVPNVAPTGYHLPATSELPPLRWPTLSSEEDRVQ